MVGIAGGIDPVTGDIYRGLDSFGRIKDLIWLGTGGNSSSSSSSSSGPATILERIQHAYDNVGNRLYRAELADSLELHDELYDYDGINRLHDLDRGTLTAARTALVAKTFAQCWSLDETGNWQNFREDDTGNGVWDLVQNRVSNPVNEITLINNPVGSSWVNPIYNAAGNMTTMPQPASPGTSFTGVYDAWNRLISLTSGANLVQQNQYDGLNRRIVKHKYASGVLSETRHFYFSSNWQDLEERVGTSTNPQKQFVWGTRYVDDLVLRDRDTTGSETLNERLYAIQDANWNVSAVSGSSGSIQERYCYTGYGMPGFLTAGFGNQSSSNYDWETMFGGYRWDSETDLYPVRVRVYAPNLGAWLARDPTGFSGREFNLYSYVRNNPIVFLDSTGLGTEHHHWFPAIRRTGVRRGRGQDRVDRLCCGSLWFNINEFTTPYQNGAMGGEHWYITSQLPLGPYNAQADLVFAAAKNCCDLLLGMLVLALTTHIQVIIHFGRLIPFDVEDNKIPGISTLPRWLNLIRAACQAVPVPIPIPVPVPVVRPVVRPIPIPVEPVRVVPPIPEPDPAVPVGILILWGLWEATRFIPGPQMPLRWALP